MECGYNNFGNEKEICLMGPGSVDPLVIAYSCTLYIETVWPVAGQGTGEIETRDRIRSLSWCILWLFGLCAKLKGHGTRTEIIPTIV